jgi:hypothetical protein
MITQVIITVIKVVKSIKYYRYFIVVRMIIFNNLKKKKTTRIQSHLNTKLNFAVYMNCLP